MYLNVLDVPGWNQDRNAVLTEFAHRIKNSDNFLLPMATIWETGNHIADLKTGGRRREYATKLCRDVQKALDGETPYTPTHFPERSEFALWLQKFPEYAMRNKSEIKTREGISLSDLSIIMEWERMCELSQAQRVLIWSLDSDLSGYDRAAVI
ncbi:hypothetical protein [Asticcacaulis excentricus]|uniref:hypothetical protein n=1 Tax=Asticcacaulis excentricus TaxID=78587 RepID=UPI000F8274E6|nr:hypothetical protein [Asticcacaulis excentricus]